MKTNWFDPNKSFTQLKIFWLFFGIGIAASIIATAFIIASSDLSFDTSHTGFNEALTIFKFPLGALAATIPIIALLAANHKSEQTKEQMRLARENNNFTNYFKHLSEFETYIEKHQHNDKISITSARRLHAQAFPRAKQGEYDASPVADALIKETIEETLSIGQAILEHRESIQQVSNNREQEREIIFKKHDEIEKDISSKKEELGALRGVGKPINLSMILEPAPQKTEAEEILIKKINELGNKQDNIRSKIRDIDHVVQSEQAPFYGLIRDETEKLTNLANEFADRFGIVRDTEKTESLKKKNYTSTSMAPEAVLERISDAINVAKTALEFDEKYSPSERTEKYLDFLENATNITATEFSKRIKFLAGK